MKVKEAAKRLNKSEQFIRIGLQHGRLPFGTAVKVSNRWNYHISEKLFDEYVGRWFNAELISVSTKRLGWRERLK